MPVILKSEGINPWVQVHHTSISDAMRLLIPYPDELKFFEVSSLVNSPKNNRKECILPLNNSNNLTLF